ncbi:hypothetical protein PybrP1_005263 [[Pythium] brassicae (nom. inval.)]|nr:hypothetical protein PybrP1_005263 [[Pythium] brassicae (nom. inval.)]
MKASALEQTPFPPLRLQTGERQRLQALAHELLHAALREYERVGAPERRQLPKARWKPVKSRENCTVFASKMPVMASSSSNRSGSRLVMFDPYNNLPTPLPSSVSSLDGFDVEDVLVESPGSPEAPHALRDAPELVLAGSVPGSLDDALLGMSACDSADVLLHSAFVDDSLVDGAVLAQLQMPTPQEPFRFLGVKWAVQEYRGQYKKPAPRDFVYLEAVGSVPRRDGGRLGYVLRHSLDLAACGELTFERSIVRGAMAMSAIFTPLGTNTVDIFARGRLSLGGIEKPSGATAQTACARALLSTANAVTCAHNRKLVWLLREQQRRGGADPAVPVVRPNMFACGMCAKKFGKLSSVGTCRVCCVQMCSRCRLTRALSAMGADRARPVESVGGVFCKNCVAHANQTSAFEVASDEVSAGRYGDDSDSQRGHSSRSDSSSSSSLLESRPLSHAPSAVAKADAFASSSSSYAAPVSYDSTRSTDVSRGSGASSYCGTDERGSHDEVSGDAIGAREFHGWSYSSPVANTLAPRAPPAQAPSQSSAAMDAHQQRQALWRKMAELRVQAESVYQLTQQNAAQMSGSGVVSDMYYDSDIDELD